MEHNKINGYSRTWWKESVVYQIYPRSFKDSNNDGIGDLNGITDSLDYLKDLGVDIIWICPIFKSPNEDNGYDISDYRAIMDDFGTMEDFDRLLAGIKERGLKILLDLVPNHSSDEHAWFQESKKSPDNPYRDYYIWQEGKEGNPPNNWDSFFGGSVWEWDVATRAYYLHLFAKKQPDLNWRNPALRKEIYDIMRFWLDKGVDGFRMDVVPFISKPEVFEDYPPDYDGNYSRVYASGPLLHEYIQEMNREVMSKYDMFTVGEAAGVPLEETPLMIDERRKELDIVFQFDAISIDRLPTHWDCKPWTLPDLKKIYARYEEIFDKHCWNAIFLGNHDVPRMLSRYGNDHPVHRRRSAKMLATLLLTLKGTPFIYQGDEIGMTNYPFKSIQEFNDIQAVNSWQAEVIEGGCDPEDFMKGLMKIARDHSRTPMQWTSDEYAGFSKVQPWMSVHPNKEDINVANALKDERSVWHYYRNLIQLRRATPELIYGDFEDLDPEHPRVFSYTRTIDQSGVLVLLNFSDQAVDYFLPSGILLNRLIICNCPEESSRFEPLLLLPYEAKIFEIKLQKPLNDR